jgi:hypothetical protein
MFRAILLWSCSFSALAILMVIANAAVADEGNGDHGHGRPVYQRHAGEWKDFRRNDRKFRHQQFVPPQVNAAWFQRPYPYHLDYYKMRYGGSYAPYFGNIYGPPQVVTAPPYYGPFSGDFGYGGGYGLGNGPYPLNYEQFPGQPPMMPQGPVEEAPAP